MKRAALCTLLISLLSGISTNAQPNPPSSSEFVFAPRVLSGAVLERPSSLQFGPDGRLYVASTSGDIDILTIEHVEVGDYFRVVEQEKVTLIRDILNHDDTGIPNPHPQRQVTGLLVIGTTEQPVIYVTSSDYRNSWNPEVGVDENWETDSNSGVISRLTWNGTAWERVDVVRGLPRSPSDHATNGLALSDDGILYVAQGGNTNMGAPTDNADTTPEYALSAAILRVDLNQIISPPYDIPTLDDPDRPGNPDENDPFGGNGGLNQAVLIPGSPVDIYAPGFRNPYDIIITSHGQMFATNNGANSGWGVYPDDCTNAAIAAVLPSDPGSLHRVTPGYYAGHPNPTRGSAAEFAGQRAVEQPNPIECTYIPPAETEAEAIFSGSFNGIVEYTASTFGGRLRGDLLSVGFYGDVMRFDLDSEGIHVLSTEIIASQLGAYPVDMTAQGDDGAFPGTLWIGLLGENRIIVLVPVS